MAYILKADLLTKILEDELDEITRDDDTILANALSAAEAELRTYLYDSYDVVAIFAATGTDRHQLLVQLGADIAIYYLVARLQAGQDTDDRKSRYDRAITWLKAAQKSETYADLPRRTETVQTHAVFGGNPKRSNYF